MSTSHIIAVGGDHSIICVSRSGQINWINVPFEYSDTSSDAPEERSIRINPVGPSWKDLEQQQRESDDRKRYEQNIEFIRSELDRIKASTVSLINANEERATVPLQFFNFDTNEMDRLQVIAAETYYNERKRLESELAARYQQIEYVQRFVWAPYLVKPIKIYGIDNKLFVENYPLTELEVKLANEQFLTEILASSELSAHVCHIRNQQRPNEFIDGSGDIAWPVVEESKKYGKISAIVAKVCDQQLSTSMSWNQNFLKYVTADDKVIDITDQHQINVSNVKVHVSRTNLIDISKHSSIHLKCFPLHVHSIRLSN